MVLRALYTGILASALLASAQASAQSLEQAVATALSQNSDIRSAYNELRSRQLLIDASQGDYLPSLDLEAGIGYENYDNDSNRGEYKPRTVRLSLRQLIWDGSKTYNDIIRNQAETEAQRYQLLSDAQDTALHVAGAYLNVIETREIVTLSQANLDTHLEIYGNIKRRADTGVGSTADLAQIEGRLARANANLLSAQSNYRDKTTEFIRLVGEEPVNLVTPEVDHNFMPPSVQHALQIAQEANPVMFVAMHDVEAAQAQYDQAEGDFYPEFFIEASQEFGEELDGSPGDTDEFKAMLRMRYNLFSGGSDRAKARRAAYQVNKAKDIRDRALQQLIEGTRLAWSAYELSNRQIQFLEQHVDASARTVTAYEKQFTIAQRTLLDVLNTENELFEARKSYLTAHFEGILAKYRVLNATGQLLDEMRVEVPEGWLASSVQQPANQQ